MTLGEVFQALPASTIQRQADVASLALEVTGIAYDSRRVQPGHQEQKRSGEPHHAAGLVPADHTKARGRWSTSGTPWASISAAFVVELMKSGYLHYLISQNTDVRSCAAGES